MFAQETCRFEGTTFTLSQHDNHPGEDGRFTLLAVDHIGANNLGAQAAQLLGHPDIEAGTYRNQFLAQPAARPILPLPLDKPVARPQTALVAPLGANADQNKLLPNIDPQQDGKHPGSVGGQSATKPQAGSRQPGQTDPDPVERFAQPLILAEAPTDIGLATPASTLLFAASHLHATTQQDLHIAAAHTVAVCAGEDASWYCHSGGIRSIAQAGSHTLQAHTASLDILADQSITVTSSNEEVRLLAKQKIVLQAGQSSVTLEGQNMTFACPGTFSVRGSGQAFLGPGRGAAKLERLPDGKVEIQDWIGLDYRDPQTGEAIAGAGYEIHFKGGPVLSGELDTQGMAKHDNIDRKEVLKVIYKPRTPDKDNPYPSHNELLG